MLQRISMTMQQPGPATPRVVELAERLAADIRARGLQPGDPYLSAIDAARMLRVRLATANRALGKGASLAAPA